jgi:hypothetical protein
LQVYNLCNCIAYVFNLSVNHFIGELNFTGKYMYGSTEVNGWYGFVGGQHVTMTTTVNECIFMSSTRMGMMADGKEFCR